MAKVKYTKAQRARIRRRRLRQIRGAIFLVFAVIGLISVVSFVIGKVRTVSNDDDQKLEFAKLIAPMVSLDPVPFESIERRNRNSLRKLPYGVSSITKIPVNTPETKPISFSFRQLMLTATSRRCSDPKRFRNMLLSRTVR